MKKLLKANNPFSWFYRHFKLLVGLALMILLVGGGFELAKQFGFLGPKVTSSLVSNRIEESSDLVSTKYYYTNAASYSDATEFSGTGWEIPFTTKSFIIVYDGTIQSGIDLAQVKTEIKGKTISLQLPKAKIISHELDLKNLKVLDETDGLFNPVTVSEQNDFIAQQKEDVEAKALENGLLTAARDNAEKVLETLILQDDWKEAGYKVEFK